MDKRRYHSWFLILLLCSISFGTLGDIIMGNAGNKVVWPNNSQTFSIAGSPSMSESVNYIWPVADGDPGQVMLTNGLGVFSFADVNAIAGTHKKNNFSTNP